MIFAPGFFLSPTAWPLEWRRAFLVSFPVLWPAWLLAWTGALIVGAAAVAVAVLAAWVAALWNKPTAPPRP